MGNIKKQLDTLLSQEMDRKNFLRYSGGIVLALIGVTGLMRILLSGKTTTLLTDQVEKKQASNGYGYSRYGQ